MTIWRVFYDIINYLILILARTFRSRTRGYLNNNTISRFSNYSTRGNRNTNTRGRRNGNNNTNNKNFNR